MYIYIYLKACVCHVACCSPANTLPNIYTRYILHILRMHFTYVWHTNVYVNVYVMLPVSLLRILLCTNIHFTQMYKALYICMAYTCVCHVACLSLANILVYTYTWCILHIFIMCILHMYGIDMCTLCRLSLFCYYSTLSLSHSFSLSSFLLWKNKEAIDPPFYV